MIIVDYAINSLISLTIYMIPSINAYFRKHKQLKLIIVGNILFGWTIIGWVYALIWSFREKKVQEDKIT